ncbi:MAG: AAA family ATPase [Rhodospirillales bacterium]|nr:AAA family ATPase [Rhodospirillales bacterium]
MARGRPSMTHAPLPAELLHRRCDPSLLPFETTAELGDIAGPVGQQRAVEAVRFGIGIRAEGYNLFALGPTGTGKSSIVRHFLAQAAERQPVPDDWCYVNNFAEAHRPRALRLPAGRAPAFRKDMERLVEELRIAIPAAFEGDEYRNRRQAIEEGFKNQQESSFGDIQRRASERDIALIRTPLGLALAPVKDGEVVSPEDFKKLPEERQGELKHAMEELQKELEATIKLVPRWEREHREKIRALDEEVTNDAVGHLVDELMERYRDCPAVGGYLEAVRADVAENYGAFLPQGGEERPAMPARMAAEPERDFRRYRVNVLVSNGEMKGAPVVGEDHPTQPNLVGRIEHIAQYGALVTDFNLIKAGCLHRANGGYLVLDARKLLMQPFSWEELKRTLQAREIRIESPAQTLGLLSTVSLEPEPIPLDVKVVLIGDPMLYYLLNAHDPDFAELFKVAADFDYRMDRDGDTVLDYARLMGMVARQEGLRPLARDAVARMIEHAARLAEDAEKLTTHMASITDLVREADYWAAQAQAPVIAGEHVRRAIDAQVYRSDRIRQHVQEEIARGTLLIDTAGAVVGQINALSVLQIGRFAFGRPTRVTCRVRIGKGEVVDIEREVQLGGPLHSKGVMILSSFLSSRFAAEAPLSLAASLVFEQSYGGVDGDSASSTELYALLSALAEAPIRQSLAVTGSVNQHGRVQAIGGVNEKIEGFFDVCQARGLDGSHGVLIPASNVKHLMLRPDVVAAAENGLFKIYAVETVDQGIEILTGVPAGEKDERGEYPVGSLNRRVAARLAALARKARALAAQTRTNNGNDR